MWADFYFFIVWGFLNVTVHNRKNKIKYFLILDNYNVARNIKIPYDILCWARNNLKITVFLFPHIVYLDAGNKKVIWHYLKMSN